MCCPDKFKIQCTCIPLGAGARGPWWRRQRLHALAPIEAPGLRDFAFEEALIYLLAAAGVLQISSKAPFFSLLYACARIPQHQGSQGTIRLLWRRHQSLALAAGVTANK